MSPRRPRNRRPVAAQGDGPPNLSVLGLGFVCVPVVGVFLLLGQGKRARSTWQCPECHFFNHPTTLVCPCGQRFEAEPAADASADAD